MKINIVNAILVDDGDCLSYKIPLGVFSEPLARFRGIEKDKIEDDFKLFNRTEFNFEFNNDTTLRDLGNRIIREVNFKKEIKRSMDFDLFDTFIRHKAEFGFINNGIVYYFRDENKKLISLIEKFKIENILYVFLAYSKQAGCICKEDGIKFYMNSKENGHNKPHVHLDYKHDYRATMDIQTGELLSGKFPKKLLKKAQKVLDKEKIMFINAWNQLTNGLAIDLNQYLKVNSIDYPY